MQIHGVDEEPAFEVIECDVADEMFDQGFQRFTAVEGGRQQAAECDIGPGYLEHIPAANQTGSGFHLIQGYARSPGRADQ